MPTTNSARKGRSCPNCAAFVPLDQPRCSSCKLEVSKMQAFAAAKEAARQRGMKGTKVVAERSLGQMIGTGAKYAFLILLVGAVAAGGWWLFKPRPPRYLKFAATGQAAVTEFMTDISGGGDPQLDAAYGLLADSVRDPKENDHGDYLQIYDELNNYLAGEFGSDWITRLKVTADPADPNLFAAHIGPETLHVRVAQQTPADKMKEQGEHYGIMQIEEFSVTLAADFRQMEGIKGVLRAYPGAGNGAVEMLDKVLGASGAAPHNAPMIVKKVRLLAVIRNPREVSSQAILLTYPLRNDPVVKARLAQIAGDERYDTPERQRAKEVYDDKVPEEELISVGLGND